MVLFRLDHPHIRHGGDKLPPIPPQPQIRQRTPRRLHAHRLILGHVQPEGLLLHIAQHCVGLAHQRQLGGGARRQKRQHVQRHIAVGARCRERPHFIGAGIEQQIQPPICRAGIAHPVRRTGYHVHQIQRGTATTMGRDRKPPRRHHMQQRFALRRGRHVRRVQPRRRRQLRLAQAWGQHATQANAAHPNPPHHVNISWPIARRRAVSVSIAHRLAGYEVPHAGDRNLRRPRRKWVKALGKARLVHSRSRFD